MEQKALESPELRTQHILSLHKELLESKIQIKTLEQALSRLGRYDSNNCAEDCEREGKPLFLCAMFKIFIFSTLYALIGLQCTTIAESLDSMAHDTLQNRLRSEQREQAQRVESLVQNFIIRGVV